MHGSALSRRTFLAMVGAAPFAVSARPVFGRLRENASATQGREVPVGLELYSVRTELAKDLRNTVTAVAKMGYRIVEFYSPYFEWTPDMARSVRQLLDDLGIACRSTHNGSESFTPDGLKKAIDLNTTIGSKYIVMAHPGTVNGADGWKAVADRLTAAAERLRPLGLAAGYHNHQAEWAMVDGRRPIEILAAGTPKDVVLQLDVGTCLEAGADPAAWINANPGRIRSIHCKDWSPSRHYAVAFGEGDAPWRRIFAAAESTGGIEYYLIEQEESPDQLAMAQQCLANWKKLRDARG